MRSASPCRLAVLALCAAASLRGGVAVSEIHYNPGPAGDSTLEFVELINTGGDAVDLAGWRFTEGIDHVFPPETRIQAGGYLVVCRNRVRLLARYGLSGDGVAGDFEGRLDDNGERLVLRDDEDRIADVVRYQDLAPWPENADGMGASLQRICPDAPGILSTSWVGETPTPGAPTAPGRPCPPPFAPPAVAISEIHYHPLGDRDESEEFVELFNPGAAPVDLSGWELRGAVYTFPLGTVIEPGAYLVACRSAAVARVRFGLANAVGDFAGRLSNSSERIALFDATGTCIDAVFYDTEGDWPAAPDGNGFSLERVSYRAPGEDPANWATSLPAAIEGFVEGSGKGTRLFPGERYVALYLEGEGACIVDDVVLEDEANPGTNLLANGGFDGSAAGWTIPAGVHGTSAWTPDGGVGGGGAMHLIALEDCGAACGRASSVYAKTAPLASSATYALRMKVKHLRGAVRVVADVDGKVTARVHGAGVHTAGRPNAAARERVPPFLEGIGRFPREPGDRDSVAITARVRGQTSAVVLRAVSPAGAVLAEYPLADDGAHEDGRAGDGVWGVTLGPRAHGTVFLYTLALRAPDGAEAVYPRPHELSPCFGYYVDAGKVDSVLPVYHLLLPGLSGASPESVNAHLSCWAYKTGHFAFEGEVYPHIAVRMRGNTACLLPKAYLKLRFNHGRYFKGLRKANLNSLWTDKAQVREHLAWELVRGTGAPWCATEYVRLHLNGEYYGLYLYLEHPDSRFLRRNGIDGDGQLFKAEMGPHGIDACDFTPGVSAYTWSAYGDYWQKETNQDGDFAPLADFIDSLHREQGSLAFFQERVDPESLILFQAGQVALGNFDSAVKNHFLLQDAAAGLWHFLPWDLDLSFGKYFTPDAVGPGREVGTLNDYMTCPDPLLAMTPLYAAEWYTLCQKPGNWLMYYFFRAGNGYYQRAYLIRLWDLLQEKYTRERYDPAIDALCDFLRDEEAEDLAKWGRYPSNIPAVENPPPPEMLPNAAIMKEQITCHRGRLLPYFSSQIRAHPRLRITEIMAMPEDPDEALEFIELYNPSDTAVDASGWSIAPIGYVFPQGTAIPARGIAVVARDPAAFRARYDLPVFGPFPGRLDNRGETLRVYDAGGAASYPAVVDLLPYGNSDAWPEQWRGHSIELAAPEEQFADNDRPELWARSVSRGGTPGTFRGVLFSRGDIDQNGKLQIGDAVQILLYLFAQGREPACLDGADVNGDGRMNLADAITLLAYMFGGGAPPAPPFGACGLGTGTALGCARFDACAR